MWSWGTPCAPPSPGLQDTQLPAEANSQHFSPAWALCSQVGLGPSSHFPKALQKSPPRRGIWGQKGDTGLWTQTPPWGAECGWFTVCFSRRTDRHSQMKHFPNNVSISTWIWCHRKPRSFHGVKTQISTANRTISTQQRGQVQGWEDTCTKGTVHLCMLLCKRLFVSVSLRFLRHLWKCRYDWCARNISHILIMLRDMLVLMNTLGTVLKSMRKKELPFPCSPGFIHTEINARIVPTMCWDLY